MSTLFGNKGTNWGQAVNSKLFAFESSAYDVSEVSFDTETGQIDITASARVPEPASFALVLLALAAMGMPRRRRRSCAASAIRAGSGACHCPSSSSWCGRNCAL